MQRYGLPVPKSNREKVKSTTNRSLYVHICGAGRIESGRFLVYDSKGARAKCPGTNDAARDGNVVDT